MKRFTLSIICILHSITPCLSAIHPDTLVTLSAYRGYKQAQETRKLTSVRSMSKPTQSSSTLIKNKKIKTFSSYFKLTFYTEQGTQELIVSPDTKLYLYHEATWIYAKNLKNNDVVLTADGFTTLIATKKIKEKTKLVIIEVANTHTLCVTPTNIVIHNEAIVAGIVCTYTAGQGLTIACSYIISGIVIMAAFLLARTCNTPVNIDPFLYGQITQEKPQYKTLYNSQFNTNQTYINNSSCNTTYKQQDNIIYYNANSYGPCNTQPENAPTNPPPTPYTLPINQKKPIYSEHNPQAEAKKTQTTHVGPPEPKPEKTNSHVYPQQKPTTIEDTYQTMGAKKKEKRPHEIIAQEQADQKKPQPLTNEEFKKLHPHGKYVDAPYHKPGKKSGRKSPAPTNGQKALDVSIECTYKGDLPPNAQRRLAILEKEFVVLDETTNGEFHGHVRTWDTLHPRMKRDLHKAKLVNKQGKIL